MASLSYEIIYSKFFSKVSAYDFLELPQEHLDDFLCNWIHSAAEKPYIRRLFSSYSMDDEIHQITYIMRYTIDENSDLSFVTEIIALGMVMEWLEPKINNISNIAQLFGSKEEKFFAQANHLSQLQNLMQSISKKQRRIIADRGYAWNSYLDGE